MATERLTLTVTQLNEYIKAIIDNDKTISNVYVKGEISNFTHHKTGHLYFTLKDATSNLKAVMFAREASKLAFEPENGMKVTAHGRISAFVRDGSYQIYVTSMEPDGVGALTIAFEQLKRKLAAEGLFDTAKKKPIPKIPTRVGIITSPTGAAVRDIINIAGRRFPYAKLVIYPALVQGSDAPPQLVSGIEFFNMVGSVDLIIIGRGGGSIEDLWAFNDETLARAIYASAIPVISAVGHEIDFTISDFVADLRAPTPSAAAELALPDTGELIRKVNNITTHMQTLLSKQIGLKKQLFEHLRQSKVISDPMSMLDQRKMALVADTQSLSAAMKIVCAKNRTDLAEKAAKLDALSPLAVFSRGYSVALDKDGRVVRSIGDVEIGENLAVRTTDGRIIGKVIGKEPFEYGNG